jgi:hypothetical protein
VLAGRFPVFPAADYAIQRSRHFPWRSPRHPCSGKQMLRKMVGRRKGRRAKGFFCRAGHGSYTKGHGQLVPLTIHSENGSAIGTVATRTTAAPQHAHNTIAMGLKQTAQFRPAPQNHDSEILVFLELRISNSVATGL